MPDLSALRAKLAPAAAAAPKAEAPATPEGAAPKPVERAATTPERAERTIRRGISAPILAGKEQPESEAAPEKAAPKASTEAEDAGGQEPAEIDVPEAWADDVDSWKSLPPEAQERIAKRESERTTLLKTRDTETEGLKASTRKAHDEARAKWSESFNFLKSVYSELEKTTIGQEPDFERILTEQGSDAYNMAKEQWGKKKAAFDQTRQKLQLAHQQASQEAAQALEAWKNEQRSLLVKHLPEWGDKAKAEAKWKKVEGYLSNLGFGPEELQGLIDHRHYRIIEDALAWREHSAKRPAIEAKVKEAPKMAAPGPAHRSNPGQRAIQEARTAHRREGSLRSLGRLMGARLAASKGA